MTFLAVITIVFVKKSAVVIGKESTGKSQLIAALTGQTPYSANFRGSTVTCDTYQSEAYTFIDTPGILYRSDSVTTKKALRQLQENDTVLLVVKATDVDRDLADLLPLVADKRGIVVITFWDKVFSTVHNGHLTGLGQPQTPCPPQQVIREWTETSNLSIVTVDARHITTEQKDHILASLQEPNPFPAQWIPTRAGWYIEPHPTLLEHPRLGSLLAIALLLIPAIIAVWGANSFATLADPIVQSAIAPVIKPLSQLPIWLREILIGQYGLITMSPLLFIWAMPTVILYALFLGAYKASGLIERITIALNPLLRPFGLSGRDLVRVIMGMGCNVPAVISTRACSSCSRGTCISAIAFGSACSYQFGATLGVFSAAKLPYLIIPYLLYLTATTLIYTYIISSPTAKSNQNPLVIEGRAFLEFPHSSVIWREAKSTINQFLFNAIPIFLVITVIASVLNWLGTIAVLANIINPLMGWFNLPPEASLPIVLASIRKDGLLLFAEPETLAMLTPLQVLTGVYLAGVLLPCLVTLLTITREQSLRFALLLLSRQAIAAIFFSLLLAWGGLLIK
ncbi:MULTISPECIES: nucleoside recognition domain-containing protein [Moorena]|uniref:Fe2+ transport system protein B n=1 Tax=Moorena producens 3L TaxID=489825 RepID=F4XU24_9CYAN|nr:MULTISPECIES: nucleoside recognition domain-containing protein [Moorena]EGJ32000.1 Fe2+ transport system protein B [Moorena producens 3L]NEP31143.1 ferrous iron transporter B [Moorena sp. SIO3B2]NEP64721.1 ferrous iron transporter B [Moorena sp. SIO3A5]NEQ05004.1 ferrous iron transporter B [Moorena sp. SIO4E2]NER85782.1 ferrous iron transporter B [Moorena sp. SIO3A2]